MTLQAQFPADSVAAALRDIFAAPEYAWTTRVNLWARVREWFGRFMMLLGELAETHPLLYIVLLGVLSLILVLLLAHIASVLRRALRPSAAQPTVMPVFAAPRDATWHHAESHRLARDGRYAEALGHRFFAMVLDLERLRALKVQPSTTPAEYARSAKLDDESRSAFRDLVAAFYATRFAGRACDAEGFGRFDETAGSIVRRARAV